MSLTKAKERAEAQGNVAAAAVDVSQLCTEPGCRERWTTSFYGRLCSFHEAQLTGKGGIPRPASSIARIPLRPAARPYCEVDDEAA